ncbi:MAG: hypothetical protein JNN26_00135 [Candidatus Obscuribacter sp.]|nr:hypothetical protein [Candidatus Obscuribacter sp.]MBL8080988.1 hypothetical protein [Candidatus Obscuribacter sp.]
MAHFITCDEDLVKLINKKAAILQGAHQEGEMLIVPLVGVASLQAAGQVLAQVHGFQSRKPEDGIFEEAAGVLRLRSERCVEDMLVEFGSGLIPTGLFHAVCECLVEPCRQAGVAVVKNPLGEPAQLYVDKNALSAKTGLPLQSSKKNSFACLLLQATCRLQEVRPGEEEKQRLFLVAVRGAAPKRLYSQIQGEDVLREQFPQMLSQARAGFEQPFTFSAPNLKDGWQMAFHPSFCDFLAHLRGGYGYILRHNPKGGLLFGG